MAAIFGEGKIFKNWQEYIAQIPCGSKIDEITLSRTVKEIEGNLKIQNGRHFWGGENFLKIMKRTFLRYPGGRKLTKSLYLARLRRYPGGRKLTKSLYLARLRR